jgi:hypothetical protein
MIVGMVELLTVRGATGWAYDDSDPTMPLIIRARDGESVLVQTQSGELRSPLPLLLPQTNQACAFRIEFPARLEERQLAGLTIEAALTGGDRWRALSGPLKIGGAYLHSQPPLLQDSDWESGLPGEAVSPKAKDASFWSARTGEESFDRVESRPVFVVGAARSGTTALCLALERGTRYRGFPEGHVFDVAIRLANAVNAHFEKKARWISPKVCRGYHLGHIAHARFQAEIIELLRRLAAGYTTPYWLDKTPTYEMIASVPLLAQAWPGGRFIFMKRRGLENLRSRLRKFPGINFSGNCRDWAQVMSGWRTVREGVPDRFVEIDQRTMLLDPDSTAERVGRLLDLEPAEVEAFADVLRRERPETTDPSGSIVADPSELGWSAEQMEAFRSICGAEMGVYGYTYGAQYCR